MRRRHWRWLASLAMAAVVIGGLAISSHRKVQAQPAVPGERDPEAAEMRELERHAKRLGVNVAEFVAEQHKHERAMQREQAKQQPQLLIHEDSLFVLMDKVWLFQFDVKTLELKAMENLEILRHEFMEELEAEERGREKKGR